uniref:Uncharacterized protein n=1 Tax=Oryza officinalis TaxID=4535 RepID=A0A1V1H0W3_9ORYZ|nr:hypothetical protein [Oryza officinalis]
MALVAIVVGSEATLPAVTGCNAPPGPHPPSRLQAARQALEQDASMIGALLWSACWVDSLDEESASGVNLDKFKLTAWTFDPYTIPKSKLLRIMEPMNQSAFCGKPFLDYDVIFHLTTVEDFQQPPKKYFAPSSDSSGMEACWTLTPTATAPHVVTSSSRTAAR